MAYIRLQKNVCCNRHCITSSVLLFLLLAVLPLAPGQAFNDNSTRIYAGLDIFPAFLAANIDIDKKKGADNKLLLVLLYVNKKDDCLRMAKRLEKSQQIRGIPIRVELSREPTLAAFVGQPVAGIFLCQKLYRDLPKLLNAVSGRNVLVFSPFAGDVEAGTHGGIAVRDRILPFVNTVAIHKDGIRLKQFFLRIAKHYD